MNRGIKTLKTLYKKAKEAKVGETIFCPSCGKPFEKANYQQAFCKTKTGTICKDYYWNNVTPTKRNNTTRISPANEAFYEMHIEPLKRTIEESEDLDDDQSWDAHKDSF